MLTVKNIKRFDNVPFDQYAKWPEWSHSKLKSQVSGIPQHIDQTDKMRLGSLVDGILMQPAEVDMLDDLYPLAIKMAKSIRDFFNRDVTKRFDSQPSYRAEIHCDETGLVLPIKNRPDWALPPHFVVDLKVSETVDTSRTYAHFGYENQLWLQTKVCECNSAFILWANPKYQVVQLRGYPISATPEFWREAVRDFGK